MIENIIKVQNFIYTGVPPGIEFRDVGPKMLEMRYVINAFKGLTVMYVVLLMWYYQNFSTGMYLYMGLHGSYGMAWLFKDLVFGDKTF